MASRAIRALSPGYTAEFDTADEHSWYQVLQSFEDANIYQTWAYASVLSGQRNMGHLILRKNGDIVAIALARTTTLPLLNTGIAYVMWGPLWRRRGTEAHAETLRQAIRALRNEYVGRRKLVLRLFPILFDDGGPCPAGMLEEEGFCLSNGQGRGRTILMDLTPRLEDLRAGMRPHWARELKVAEKRGLEIIQGSDGELFEGFIAIYKEMVSRKRFLEPNDIHQFRRVHAQLPDEFKMKVLLCKSGDEVGSGLVCSAIGNTAVYLFGATSNAGLKSRGSYLLQWKLLEELKQNHISLYNLNGINPQTNPGTYKFKDDLAGKNGKDVYFLGRFDAHANLLSHFSVETGERLRMVYRTMRKLANSAYGFRLWPQGAN